MGYLSTREPSLPKKTTAEDLLVDICLLSPRGRVSSYRPSHVCLFSMFSWCKSSSTKRVLMRDGCFVESPSGIGIELRWRLQYVHGAPVLHSKSTVSQPCPHTICQRVENFMDPVFCTDITQVSIHIHPPWGFGSLLTSFLQIHSAWAPAQGVCAVPNTESSKANIIAVLVSDVVLLLTMLIRLLRLRQHGTIFALGQLLWNQVGSAGFRLF